MRLFLACCLLALCLTGYRPAVASPGDQVQSAGAQTGAQTEVTAYFARIDQTLALAVDGQYGKLKRGAAEQLHAARDRIAGVLATRTTFADLSLDDRMAIQNAEDAITAILHNNDKERMVCTRQAKTGTRFSTTECMTVAQREERANSAAEATGTVQRETCVPGETSSCR